jgi:hypothetical protein
VASRFVQCRDVGFEEVGEDRRDGRAGEVRSDELLGVEGVALTASYELVDQRRRWGDAEHRRRVHGHRLAREPVQHDAFGAGYSAELRAAAAHGGIAGHFVVPQGSDQHHALVDEVAGQVLEQVPGARIAPVQIVEADDGGSGGGEVTDELQREHEELAHRAHARDGEIDERLERARFRRRVGALRMPHQIHQRRERDRLAAHLHATTDVQRGAGLPAGFLQQRRLPDAAVTDDDEHSGPTLGGA